jgi:hypothetical protein
VKTYLPIEESANKITLKLYLALENKKGKTIKRLQKAYCRG